MGGSSYHATTQESTTAPWSVNTTARRPVTVYQPLWKELPWHIEHPGWFALLAGTSLTGALWLLTRIS